MKTNKPSPQESPAQGAPQPKKWPCPYWDTDSRSCQLVTDSLFMPAKQHVVCYCLSMHYPSCPHYELLASINQVLPINRRRSVRVPRHHRFRFFTISESNQRLGNQEYEAWTMGLSEHGLRCTGLYLLPPKTAIRFFLDADGDGDGAQTEGTGSVIWSKQLKNKPLFYSRIAFNRPFAVFTTNTTKQSKRHRAGLPRT